MKAVLFAILLFYCYALYRALNVEKDVFEWDPIVRNPPEIRGSVCVTDDECASSEKCYEGRCTKLADNATECNPHTGRWILHKPTGTLRCECLFPDMVVQNFDGGNCEVDVVCGQHGRLNSLNVDLLGDSSYCVCESGYVSEKLDGKPTCRKITHGEYDPCLPEGKLQTDGTCACPPDFVDSESAEARRIFHPGYLQSFSSRKCLKMPCTFNALNYDQKLSKNVFDDGCLCDPTYGNFAVHLEVEKYLRNGAYNNACANVFVEEKRARSESSCVYYYMRHVPICFVRFSDFKKEWLLDVFRDATSLIVREEWPDCYFNQILLRKRNEIQIPYDERINVSHLRSSRTLAYYDEIPNCSDLLIAKTKLSSGYKEIAAFDPYVCVDTDPKSKYYSNVVMNPRVSRIHETTGVSLINYSSHVPIKVATLEWKNFDKFKKNLGDLPSIDEIVIQTTDHLRKVFERAHVD